MNVEEPRSRASDWWVDAAIVLLILAGWIAFVAHVTGGRRVILYDTFRDMASAENMRAGRIWADPALPGYSYWYAPGSPLLVAGISLLTGRPVPDLYGYAAFWCNAWIPVLLYLLVRSVWDRLSAVMALAAVYLGSYTWLTHAVAAIPSLQGVALNLAGLWCWHRCVMAARTPTAGRGRAAWAWPLLTGVALSVSALYHPLCGMMLAGAIFLHAALDAAVPGLGVATGRSERHDRRALVWRMVVVAAVAGVLTAPLILHMLPLHAKNSALLRFFADESMEPIYYAHALTPLVVPCALAGVWFILRRSPHAAWVVTYLLVGLAGQAAGFLAQVPGLRFPFLLPHEFLWHGQLAVGICAGVGIAGLPRAVAGLVKPPLPDRPALAGASRSDSLRVLGAVLLAVAALSGGLCGLPQTGKYLLDLESPLADTRELREWIRANTSLDATFVCSPEVGYQIVSAMTGRKVIVGPPCHTNPGADVARRSSDVWAMLETADPQTFAGLAASYGATHLLLVFDSAQTAEADAARTRHAAWSCLEPAFTSRDGTAIVYRIRIPPE